MGLWYWSFESDLRIGVVGFLTEPGLGLTLLPGEARLEDFNGCDCIWSGDVSCTLAYDRERRLGVLSNVWFLTAEVDAGISFSVILENRLNVVWDNLRPKAVF